MMPDDSWWFLRDIWEASNACYGKHHSWNYIKIWKVVQMLFCPLMDIKTGETLPVNLVKNRVQWYYNKIIDLPFLQCAVVGMCSYKNTDHILNNVRSTTKKKWNLDKFFWHCTFYIKSFLSNFIFINYYCLFSNWKRLKIVKMVTIETQMW